MLKTMSILAMAAVLASLAACGHDMQQRAATGAVAGGVVAGPVGAVVGAGAGAVVDTAAKNK
jgi:osmotically inducible lipoprotein OsmB